MGQVTGGQLVARALKREGVKCAFGLTVGHLMPIFYGLREEGIQLYDTRHESAAGYAADAYARITGVPGVLMTTAGPGVTNTLTAMAEAADAGSPVLHIGGATPEVFNDTGTSQDIETVKAMAAFCRFAKKCRQGLRIPEYIAMAYRYALDDTPGPVYLEIPAEILKASYDEDDVVWPQNTRAQAMAFGEPRYIEAAAKLLSEAKRPVLVLGEQARYSAEYGAYVRELVHYLQMPVMTTPLTISRGLFANEAEDELFDMGEGAAAEADVILELCATNHQTINRGRPPLFCAGAKIIQVHPDRTKIGYNAPADVGIVAGAGGAAMQLLEQVKKLRGPVTDTAWVQRARELNNAVRAPFIEARTDTTQPPVPGRLAGEVAKFLEKNGPDWTVVCDGGDAAQWMLYNATARRPGQVLKFGILGTIGTGAGFSIGAFAATGKPVLYFSGDGSFGFYSMEFDTFVRHNMPVLCVISNDAAWGMIKLSQQVGAPDFIAQHGHHPANLLAERAYEKLPEVWGGVGVKISRWEDVVPALEKVAASGQAGIVNCDVDREAMSPRTRSFAGVANTKK